MLSLALACRGDNHEVDVRPGQAELGGMRAIDLHLTVWQGLLDHGGYILNQVLLQGLHLSEYVLDGISELEHLDVQLVEHLVLVLKHLLLGALLLEALYHVD